MLKLLKNIPSIASLPQTQMHYNMNFLDCKQNIQSVGKKGVDVDSVDNVDA
jgi:hypothetical protein